MKRMCLMFLMILLFASVVFAEGIEGVFGIKWGASPDDVQAVMNQKGWKLTDVDDGLVFEKQDGTFAGLPVAKIVISFDNAFGLNTFSGAEIIMEPIIRNENVQESINTQQKVITSLIDLYGLTYKEVTEDNLDDGSPMLTHSFFDCDKTSFFVTYALTNELIFSSLRFIDFNTFISEEEEVFERIDGFNGVFGIDFGVCSSEVKEKMTEKGWISDAESRIFMKSNGTFADIPVRYVSFDYEEDSFVDVMLCMEPIILSDKDAERKAEDINIFLAIIADLYELAPVYEEYQKTETMSRAVYLDPKGNRFIKSTYFTETGFSLIVLFCRDDKTLEQ